MTKLDSFATCNSTHKGIQAVAQRRRTFEFFRCLDGVATWAWVDLWNVVVLGLVVLDVRESVRAPEPRRRGALVLRRDLRTNAIGQDVHVRTGRLVPEDLPLVLPRNIDLIRAPNTRTELDLLRSLLLGLRLSAQARLGLVRSWTWGLHIVSQIPTQNRESQFKFFLLSKAKSCCSES